MFALLKVAGLAADRQASFVYCCKEINIGKERARGYYCRELSAWQQFDRTLFGLMARNLIEMAVLSHTSCHHRVPVEPIQKFPLRSAFCEDITAGFEL